MDKYSTKFTSRAEYIAYVIAACKYTNLVVKFSAKWCVPCQNIQAYCLQEFDTMHQETQLQTRCIEVDIDDSMDVFSMLKKKKMITGVPTLFLYRKNNNSCIPDESVSGTHVVDLDFFFDNI